MDTIYIACGAILGIAVSMVISAACGGSPLWGLLGPIGWIIAALRGVQDAIRETRSPPRA